MTTTTMRDRTQRRRGGFTLIEITIVVAILAILLAPMAMLEQKFTARYYDLAARNSAAQEANQMVARLERDLAMAKTVRLSPRLDGLVTGVTRWEWNPDGRLERDHVVQNREVRVADFVAYADGNRVVVTLEVVHKGYQSGREIRWKMVRHVPVRGRMQ